MALELLPLVLHHAEVPPAHKLVLMGIANHQRDGKAWPSVARLAFYAGIGERRTQEILRELADMELITVKRSKGPKGLNVYAITIACPEGCDRTPNHRMTGVHSTAPGVHSTAPRGALSSTKGVHSSSPEPVSINQYRTHDPEKILREITYTSELLDSYETLREHAEAQPTCEHGLRLLACEPCCKALNERKAI